MHDTQRLRRALQSAQQGIRLLDRSTPNNWSQEIARLVTSFERGQPHELRPSYQPPPDLGELLGALAELETHARQLGPVGELAGDRIAELILEGQMVEAIGTPRFVELARQRFRTDVADRVGAASELAERWIAGSAEHSAQGAPFSDDRQEPSSLLCQVELLLAKYRVDWQVQVEPALASLASVGEGVVRVRGGVRVDPLLARSLAIHEVEGHALVRTRANRQALLIAQLGGRRGLDHQEGRAVALEEQRGALPASRRRTLGLRHLAAEQCLAGAEFVDVVGALLERGSTPEEAVTCSARVFRGGGLAREIVYMPRYLEHLELVQRDPEAEDWTRNAAVDWATAMRLNELGIKPSTD